LTDSNNVQPDEILVQKAEKKISLRFKKLDAAIVEIKILGHLASKFYHKNMDKVKAIWNPNYGIPPNLHQCLSRSHLQCSDMIHLKNNLQKTRNQNKTKCADA
jgi:hypothetical protein